MLEGDGDSVLGSCYVLSCVVCGSALGCLGFVLCKVHGGWGCGFGAGSPASRLEVGVEGWCGGVVPSLRLVGVEEWASLVILKKGGLGCILQGLGG